MNKTVKIVLVVIFVSVLLFISFLVSGNSNGKESNKENLSMDQASDQLNSIIEYSESLGSDERESINKIDVAKYLELYKDLENHVVLFYSDSCQYCKIAIPILENIKKIHGVEINGVDVVSLTNDEKKQLVESNEFFKEGVSTPLILIVGNDKIVDQLDSVVSSEDYQSLFKKYGFME